MECVSVCVCGTVAVSAYVSMGHPGESNKRRRSEQPAALPLSEHTYRHPSSCPALCHASQEDADGFTLDPGLSPLSLSTSLSSALPPPSVCHLLHPSLLYLLYTSSFSHSRSTYFVTHIWAAWYKSLTIGVQHHPLYKKKKERFSD